jgi:CBS domain-containing protein
VKECGGQQAFEQLLVGGRREKMRVRDVMVGSPAFCRTNNNLGEAVEILWNRNCGFLPVLDDQEKVIGVVTDRDISIAMGTRNRLAGEIVVGEVLSPRLFYCKPEDDIHAALQVMAEKKVRRLPVVSHEGKLEGILTMDDIVLHADNKRPGKFPELSSDDVLNTLKGLYWPSLPQVAVHRQVA